MNLLVELFLLGRKEVFFRCWLVGWLDVLGRGWLRKRGRVSVLICWFVDCKRGD